VESDDDKPQPGMKYADVLALNPFISGKTAMALVGNYLVNQIRDVQWMDPEQKLNWDMVTLPSDNQATNNINYVWIYNVMAINSKSSNVKAAWQFIKYMNSDEYARISSTSLLNDSLTSRKAYLKDEEGHNYGAFYNLTLSQNDVSWIEKLPRAFHSAFYRAGEDELARVFEGQASLDQALQKLEAEGTRLLTRLQD
jgi:multiple sugar transport system substrate-binding protein